MEKIVHVTTFADSPGGMQTIVTRHRSLDRTLGFDSKLVKLFESSGEPMGFDAGLEAKWWWRPGQLRCRFQTQAHPEIRGKLAIYHNGWALPLLAPGDGARRRLAYLHTDWPHFNVAIPAMSPWCDGFIVTSDEMRDLVRRALPNYPLDRIYLLPYPVEPPAGFSANEVRQRAESSVFRAGMVGRMQVGQKRMDRLPGLVAKVARRESKVSWDLIGDGTSLPDLRKQLRGADVTFHGWLTGEAYWRQLGKLDAVIFLSDYEGGPIAMLEAMACGAVPLYPAIGGMGESYARDVDPICVYSPGDLSAAAENLIALSRREREPLRARAVSLVTRHSAENYTRIWAEMVRDVSAREKISSDSPDRTVRWSDLLPLAAVERYYEKAIWR